MNGPDAWMRPRLPHAGGGSLRTPPVKKVWAGAQNTAGTPLWGKKSPWGVGEGGDGDAGEETAHGCDKSQRRKHLSRAEEAQRRAGEVNLSTAKTARPPSWLPEEPKELKKSFRALGRQLIEAKLFTELDRDTLGRYVVAQHQWELASKAAGGGPGTGRPRRRPTAGAAFRTGISSRPGLRQRHGFDRYQPVPPGGAGSGGAGGAGEQFLQLIQGGASHLA